MRRPPSLLVVGLFTLLGACGPKVQMGSPYEQDDERAGATADAPPTWAELPIAEAGPGVRTGEVARSRLLAVLAAGPGEFLRQLEVSPQLDGERFVGWRLVQIVDPMSGLRDLDLDLGDVLIGVNGASLSRPDELMALWETLAKAPSIECELTRGPARFTLSFTVVEDVAAPVPVAALSATRSP